MLGGVRKLPQLYQNFIHAEVAPDWRWAIESTYLIWHRKYLAFFLTKKRQTVLHRPLVVVDRNPQTSGVGLRAGIARHMTSIHNRVGPKMLQVEGRCPQIDSSTTERRESQAQADANYDWPLAIAEATAKNHEQHFRKAQVLDGQDLDDDELWTNPSLRFPSWELGNWKALRRG